MTSRAHASRLARIGLDDAGRTGLAARAGLYALLAGITASIAVRGRSGTQDDTHGALSLLAGSIPGQVALAVAGLGLALLGVARLRSALQDSDASVWRRLATALRGAFLLGAASVPVSALRGGQEGSGQNEQRSTARLLAIPGGRELVVAIGLVVLIVCGVQIRSALTGEWQKGLRLRGQPRWVKRGVDVIATVGIVARAMVFVPLGGFLIVAAVQADPAHAMGLDAELGGLGRHWWGRPILASVAVGLAVFAIYTLVEARYRNLDKA